MRWHGRLWRRLTSWWSRLGRSSPADRLVRLTYETLARPLVVLAVAGVLVALAAFGASRLEAGAPPSLLASEGSDVGEATRALERSFGAEPIVVMVESDIDETLSPGTLPVLLGLEQRLDRLPGVENVFGPGTFVGEAVAQTSTVFKRELGPTTEIADDAARRAQAEAKSRGEPPAAQAEAGERARLEALAPIQGKFDALLARFGFIGLPSITNQEFAKALVLGASDQPKPRLAWIFPDRNHALIAVRPEPGLTDAQTRELGEEIDELVADAPFPPTAELSVAGAPLVSADVTQELTSDALSLVPLAVVAMVLVLLVGLGLRLGSLTTLLPAGGAVLMTAALSALLGFGLTPATVAALPVVLGLTVDYGLQLQARYAGERARGLDPRGAAVRAMERVGPVLLLAGGSMAAGFLALTLSPVPLVDRLGITLAIGVACGLLASLVFLPALLAAIDAGGARALGLRPPRLALSPPVRNAVVGAAVALPLLGLALSGLTDVESDLKRLAPAEMEQLERIEALERELGTSGQLRIAVEAEDVTDPEVLRWMDGLQPRALALDSRLRAGPNLAALIAAGGGGEIPPREEIDQLLELLPARFTAGVLNRDRTLAEVSLGLPLLPGSEQADLIAKIQPLLETAPEGVTAELGGLSAAAASSVSGLEGGRPWLLLLAGIVVFGILLATRRRVDRAVIPLVPALAAAGLSSLLLAVSGLKLSPLSAGLEPLVLAVGVEFGLLLEARYREERRAGRSESDAATIATRAVGVPVLVAAVTVAAGFAVLLASRLGALQQFGLLAAVELLLCAAAAIALVPLAAAAWDRRSHPLRPSTPAPREPVAVAAGGGSRRDHVGVEAP